MVKRVLALGILLIAASAASAHNPMNKSNLEFFASRVDEVRMVKHAPAHQQRVLDSDADHKGASAPTPKRGFFAGFKSCVKSAWEKFVSFFSF